MDSYNNRLLCDFSYSSAPFKLWHGLVISRPICGCAYVCISSFSNVGKIRIQRNWIQHICILSESKSDNHFCCCSQLNLVLNSASISSYPMLPHPIHPQQFTNGSWMSCFNKPHLCFVLNKTKSFVEHMQGNGTHTSMERKWTCMGVV